MPEEIEVPTEHLHETMHEASHGEGPSWISQVALSAAVLAVAAAISALLAGHHANEAMIEQMQATDQWAYYQAKGIKASLVENKMDILVSIGKEPREEEKKRVDRYKEEQKGIEDKAKELSKSSEAHMHRHVVLARAVTGYQVAIALSAISVLSRKKLLWFVSLGIGLLGTLFLVQGLL